PQPAASQLSQSEMAAVNAPSLRVALPKFNTPMVKAAPTGAWSEKLQDSGVGVPHCGDSSVPKRPTGVKVTTSVRSLIVRVPALALAASNTSPKTTNSLEVNFTGDPPG